MTGQHQFSDRLQINSIGLDSPPALDSPLLTDPSRTELHNLPARWPNPRSHQRSVIVPGCFHSNLDWSCWQHNTHPLQHRGQRWRGHREVGGTEQAVTVRACTDKRSLVLSDVDRDHSHRHDGCTIERHLRRASGGRRANATSSKEPHGSLLTPPEMFGKRELASGHISQSQVHNRPTA